MDNSEKLDLLSINTIRTLSMDAVQKANSGHPGTPMALAPLGYAIWKNYLNFDISDPDWMNRDRFVLSVGHASMLLYSLIHLAGIKDKNGVALSLDELKNFRQRGSKTPGHPEYHHTAGVETTTGPLGQGFANSVGMAMAQRYLAQRYNKPGYELFNYRIYSVGGDGCMMEGVTSEAASLAGHLKLSNLCWFYDSNNISIDGSTKIAFTEDVAARFRSYGWTVLHVPDANSLSEINTSIDVFLDNSSYPTLVIIASHIGYGSPKQDKSAAHGEPLGEENIRAAKKFYGWPEEEKFLVPGEVKENFYGTLGKRGKKAHEEWRFLFSRYKKEFPDLAQEIENISDRSLPLGWDKDLPQFPTDSKGSATRESSGIVLNTVAKNIPWVIGGSADLAASTKTTLKFDKDYSSENYGGRNINFGIREHAMGSVTNGMALTGLRSFGSTFLAFTDYQKPAVRLAALMGIPNIFIYTHDSIGLGEDGPTHQPIEQLASLRATPGLLVLRPADANEVTECWRIIMNQKTRPSALVLSRQATPTIDRAKYHSSQGAAQGAYVIAGDKNDLPDVIIMATGAEVTIALEAHEMLAKENIKSRVVSMPSWEIFEEQTSDYKNKVLPLQTKLRVSVEAGSTLGWERYTGLEGITVGMKTFGASAPLKELLDQFGFTPSKIVQSIKQKLQKK